MFKVSVIQDFAAAHKLIDYQGECSNVHGHTWKVEASVSSESLNEYGMVIDFKDLKSALSAIIKKYDHSYLNEISPFNEVNPSAENIAREIYRELRNIFPGVILEQVKVWESSNSYAAYWEGQI